MIVSTDSGLSQTFEIKGGNFSEAGSVSTKIKEILKEIGINGSIIRRTAIVAYEAEMNVVMYAKKGIVNMRLSPKKIQLQIDDEGPGIKDINLAMQEGYSTATDEMREMGFGAGMGLPNMKRNSDEFELKSSPGKGTSLNIILYLEMPENE